MAAHKTWTKEEDFYLWQHQIITPMKKLASHLRKPEGAVKSRLGFLRKAQRDYEKRKTR